MTFQRTLTQQHTNKSMKTKPIHKVRLGVIIAAVWRNKTETGDHYNVKLSRIYKDENTWKSTNSFGCDDLLLVAKVADQAHSWIYKQEQEEINRIFAETTETLPAQ
jgi:hypothetical protein